ncbi:UBP-type zinc finger domain-containing protein [Gordonia terrae]|uniref:UBP-type zinc finger domain-containing protein n=1 Tax=Gordonia terrae TaxID=2055 RepID=UPI003F6C9A4F
MKIFRRTSSAGRVEPGPASGADPGPDASSAGARCTELGAFDISPADDPVSASGDESSCEDCVAIGEAHWAHLRKCLTCGHIGCCDSSPRRHATAHFHDVAHPVMRSAEPGEVWRWCYVHSVMG